MSRLGKVFSKFYGGEFSQWLRGQYDLTAYQYALDTLYNTNVQIYGPLTRRMGTNLITKISPDTSGILPVVRLIPFVVNEDVVYVLMFYGTGDNKAHMNVILPDGGFIMKTGSSTERYDLELPYKASDINNVKYAQSSDILFMVHPNYAPQQLSHYSSNDWTVAAMDFKDGPYFSENTDDDRTMTVSANAQTKVVTVTASFSAFVQEDVGRLIRVQRKADPDNDVEGTEYRWHWLKITNVNSATTVSCSTTEAIVSEATTEEGLPTSIPATPHWRLGAFGEAPGYPGAITFHQERLWLGGTDSQPQTVWSSISSDFNNYAPTDEVGDVLDDSSIVLTMLSDEVNTIQWLKSDVVLNVGTFGAEFKIFTYSAESILTPSTAQAQRVTSLGSENVDPVSLPIGTVFVQRSGRRLRHAIFTNSLTEDQTPSDLNIWASHIADTGFKDIAYQKEPNNMIWAIMQDGSLASLTYDPTQKVMGWARHKLAGVKSEVIDQCCIPVKTALQYRMFFVVDREFNGTMYRCVELMANEITDKTPAYEMVYTDATWRYYEKHTASDLNYNSSTGEITLTIMPEYESVAQNDTAGIITIQASGLNESGLYKFLSLATVAPDIPNTEYERATKLSEVAEKFLFSIQKVSGNTYKLLTQDGKPLPDKFKDCWNDLDDVTHIYECFNQVNYNSDFLGQTLQIVGDGSVLEEQGYYGEPLELKNYYAYITIGLGYRSKIKTLPVAVKTASEETTNMWTIRIIKAYANLYRSLGFKYGVEENNLSVEPFRSTKERMDEATPLFTGIKDITVGDITENKGQIILIQDQPLPLNVLSIGLKTDATDI